MNTIVADALAEFADQLEKAPDFKSALNALLIKTFNDHKRIIFNGNGYDQSWIEEAARRGLPNLVSTVEAVPHFEDQKNIDLFVKHKVFSEIEIRSRTETLLESYEKVLNIEAQTTVDMAKREILPAVLDFEKDICKTVAAKKNAGFKAGVETELAEKVIDLADTLGKRIKDLEAAIAKGHTITNVKDSAKYFHDTVFAAMQSLRTVADELETIVGADYWPIPTYSDLLFSIN